MRRVLFAFCAFVLASSVFAQSPTNSGNSTWTGTQLWPQYPPVGVGTEGSGGPSNAALQLHYNDSFYTKPAVLRFSQGISTGSGASGLIGLIPQGTSLVYPSWMHLSSLIHGQDFVMRANHGDLILEDFWKGFGTTPGGAIRMSTHPDTFPVAVIDTDYERFTILDNGNTGIDLAPDTLTGLAKPLDQFMIGGGDMGPTGSKLPGLSIYGGNRWEGYDRTSGGKYPTDWRYISFNHYQDHYSGTSYRPAPIGASMILFSEFNNGMIELKTSPPDTGVEEFEHGMTLQMNTNDGFALWCDQRHRGGVQYHSLFDVWQPDSVRAGDTLGMCFHHTPVYIGTRYAKGWPLFPGFESFDLQPAMGGSWMLAVDGPALFKEAYVNTPDWPDFVFNASYKLRPLSEVEEFINANHHLPDVPSAAEMKKSGIALGTTTATLTRKLEEQQLYIIALSKKIEALETVVENLKGAKQ